jgi:hypothetical protein
MKTRSSPPPYRGFDRLLAWSLGIRPGRNFESGTFINVAGIVIMGATAVAGAAAAKKAGKKAAQGQAAGSAAQLRFMQSQASERTAALSKLMKEGAFEFPQVDVAASADKALGVTTRNLPSIIANTKTAFDAAAANFRNFLTESFGKDAAGKPAFEEQRTAANQIVLDQMRGRLSEGTRRMLGRRALATGAVGLGRGAVQDAYTQALGIASEEQAQMGLKNYAGLYETYGRFAPNITPLDLLPYGGVTTAQSLATDQFNAEGMFRGQLAEAGAILSNIDQATQTIGPSIGPAVAGPYNVQAASAAGDAQMLQEVGATVGALFGAYRSNQLITQMNASQMAAPRTLPSGSQYNLLSDRPATAYFNNWGMGAEGVPYRTALATSASFGRGIGTTGSTLALIRQQRALYDPYAFA